jgi:hypothetical protein
MPENKFTGSKYKMKTETKKKIKIYKCLIKSQKIVALWQLHEF